MHIRRNDGFHLTFSSSLTGLLFGFALVFLTIFIATVPYYAYVTTPVLFAFPALFLLLFLPYVFIAVHQYRQKQVAVLLCSGIAALTFPLPVAIIFTFAYPHIHRMVFIDFITFTGLFESAESFPDISVWGHYLFGLSSVLPGMIAGIILLSVYQRRKRRRDAEYHQPKKKNYYYI